MKVSLFLAYILVLDFRQLADDTIDCHVGQVFRVVKAFGNENPY